MNKWITRLTILSILTFTQLASATLTAEIYGYVEGRFRALAFGSKFDLEAPRDVQNMTEALAAEFHTRTPLGSADVFLSVADVIEDGIYKPYVLLRQGLYEQHGHSPQSLWVSLLIPKSMMIRASADAYDGVIRETPFVAQFDSLVAQLVDYHPTLALSAIHTRQTSQGLVYEPFFNVSKTSDTWVTNSQTFIIQGNEWTSIDFPISADDNIEDVLEFLDAIGQFALVTTP